MKVRMFRIAAAFLLVVAAASPACAADEITSRFYERDEHGGLMERSLPPVDRMPLRAVKARRVSEEELQATLDRVAGPRAAALADIARAPAAPALVPEDLARRARVFHVAVEHYTDAAFAEFLASVGAIEGFQVVARLAPGAEWAEYLRHVPNLVLTDVPGAQYIWSEDISEISVDGTFHMTARIGDLELLRRAIMVDRMRRFYPQVPPGELAAIAALPTTHGGQTGGLPSEILLGFPDARFMLQGRVEGGNGQRVGAAMALTRGASLREAMTYLEGGNVLLGTMPGGQPFALVGRDSAAVSRALIERHLARPVGDGELRAAIAKDLGIEPARMYLVEQPWVFHLDMAMTLLRPGTVVLNDAWEAFRLQTTWMREDHEAWRPRRESAASEVEHLRDLERWRSAGRDLEDSIRRMQRFTEFFARYEARAAADLDAAGLKVVRVAGRFVHPTLPWARDIMNFLNGEAGTNAQGRTYFVTQGGDPRAERYIAEQLLTGNTGLDRLYLAPRLVSRETLWERGGMGCRVKAEGEVVGQAKVR
jgi:hypothetical protein